MLDTVMVPFTLPAVVGAKRRAMVAVAEGFRNKGVVIPLPESPAPLRATPLICTPAVPVLVMVMFCVALEPTETLPKLKEAGVACKVAVAVVVPVPLKLTVAVGVVGSLLVIVSVPVAAPAEVGWKAKVAVAEVPAAMVLGVVMPLTLNSAPAREIKETLRSAEPRLEIITVELLIEPVATVPN